MRETSTGAADGDRAMTDVSGAAATIRVGVTGHRHFDDPERVAAAVRDALGLVRERFAEVGDVGPAGAAQAATRLEAVSPLAEGADRIVAHAVLEETGTTLTVPLPFPAADYALDFSAPRSKAEFDELLARATRVEVIPPALTRDESLEQAGRWVVEHSDVLLALWDGAPSRGRGGTAEIVAYARDRGLPVYWIHTDDGAPAVEEL